MPPTLLYNVGAQAKSGVTGFSGTITARTQFLFGCNRYTLTSKADDSGSFTEACFDEGDLTVQPAPAAPDPVNVIVDTAAPDANPGNDSPQPTPPAEQPAS